MIVAGVVVAAALEARTPPPVEMDNPSAAFVFTQEASPPSNPLTLWYRKPATRWETEALPVGNGRLAAMVFGGIDQERIQFNEETVWDGVPRNTNNPEALAALPIVQGLLFEGKNDEATELARQTMMGNPYRIKSYQTLGDLLFDFPATDTVAAYRRDLDLSTAMARVQYQLKGVQYGREVFVSAPDQVIVIHLEADQPAQLSFSAALQREDAITVTGTRNRLILRGQLGIRYEAQLLPLVSGGTVTTKDGKLVVSEADEVTLLLVGSTSYNNDFSPDIHSALLKNCARTITIRTVISTIVETG